MVWLLTIYLLILAFLSLNPWFLPSPNRVMGFVTWDQVSHALAYAILSFLMILTLLKWQRPLVIKFLMVLLASGFAGALFEYCQDWFTSTRQFSIYDMTANFCGSVIGLLCFGLLIITGLWEMLRRMVDEVKQALQMTISS